MSNSFLLYEGPMGYALFQVVHKGDVVGNRLKEVQDASQDLAKFGKMVSLKSFLPFEYAIALSSHIQQTNFLPGPASKLSKNYTTSQKALLQSSFARFWS